MLTTSWITTYLRPNTDKGPNQFIYNLIPHYTNVNEVPYSGYKLTAYASGLTEAFDLSAADPAITGTVTAITNRLRTTDILLMGATTVGLRINLYNGAVLIGTYEWNWVSDNRVPTNHDFEFSGLSILAADLVNLNARVVSIGTAWTPITGLVLLSEIDHIVTYTPPPTFERIETFESPADKERTLTSEASKIQTLESPGSKVKILESPARKIITLSSPGRKTNVIN